jgi:hypothetical protein
VREREKADITVLRRRLDPHIAAITYASHDCSRTPERTNFEPFRYPYTYPREARRRKLLINGTNWQ